MTQARTTQAVDVLILGAGIAGVGLAAQLAGRRRVALLERESLPGYHATGRSAAMFIPSYGAEAVGPLTRASRAFLEVPPDGFRGSLLTPRGALHLAAPGAEARLADKGQFLTVAEATRRLPILRSEALAGAAWEPDAADIDTGRLFEGLMRQARAGGATLVCGLGEVHLERAGDLWRAVSPHGSFEAPVVVDAAGAWAGQVAREAGAASLELTPLRRTAVLVEAPATDGFATWPLAIDADEAFYFKPFGRELLISPCDETPDVPCDVQADELDVAEAVYRFEQVADHPVRTVRRRWAGLRTFAADGRPVVGWDARSEGFFWLAGLGGFGFQTAPAVARLAAALLLEEPTPADLADQGVDPAVFRPDRPFDPLEE